MPRKTTIPMPCGLSLRPASPVDVRGEHGLTPLSGRHGMETRRWSQRFCGIVPPIDVNDRQYELTALGSALHASENSWHRNTGDYVATVEALLNAGAKAPKLTDDLEASEPVPLVLRRREERSV
jgi:hypothetical protein